MSRPKLRSVGAESGAKATAAAFLARAQTALRGRPCDTCRWEKVALLDEIFAAIADDPVAHIRVRFRTILQLLRAEHGYPHSDARTLKRHMKDCRPEIWKRVAEARPDFDTHG